MLFRLLKVRKYLVIFFNLILIVWRIFYIVIKYYSLVLKYIVVCRNFVIENVNKRFIVILFFSWIGC